MMGVELDKRSQEVNHIFFLSPKSLQMSSNYIFVHIFNFDPNVKIMWNMLRIWAVVLLEWIVCLVKRKNSRACHEIKTNLFPDHKTDCSWILLDATYLSHPPPPFPPKKIEATFTHDRHLLNKCSSWTYDESHNK